MHPAVTTSETSRQCAHSHFRPQSNSNKLATLTPQLPNLSWVHQRYLMLGLVHSALPPELDLKTPRVGRAIKHTVRQRGISGEYVLVNIYLAMFPAHPSIPFVPPYSGVAHIDANTPNTSTSCYIDGTRGAFDYRRFPQLYNPRAPWRGFHDNLLTLEWQPNVCENLTVVDFFLWNQPGNPNAGGYWALHRLRELFLRREVMENEFTRLVHAANQARHPPQFCTGSPWDSFDMPFYDPLEWDDVRKWSNWIDGRDLLSNSLQYVAELKAFNRWFRTIVEPDLSSPREPSPIDMSLMGVWASTITQRAEWEFLRYNGVPVYIVTNIPDLNPLRSIVITGNLDGDERYRSNAFDATHSLESYWLIRHKKEYPLLPDLNLDLCADYLPTMLHRVVLKEPLPNSKLNSHLYTWHSPLYQVVDLNRFDSDQVQRQIDQIDTRQAIDNIFPVTTTQYKPLDTDADRHPLLDVLGISKARASKLTRYEECYDKGKNCYYPIRLGKHTSGDKEQINACDYCFFFPSLRVEIISEFPFPGRSISFKRRSDSDDGLSDSQFEVDNRPRRYFTTNQETRKPLRFAFTWEPSLDILAARAHTGTSSTKHLHEILQCPNDKGGFCSIPTLPSHQANTLQLHVFDDLIYEAIRHLSQLEHETALSELQRIGGELSIPTDYSQEIAILERRQTIKLREISWRCNYILFRDIASGRIDPLPPAKIEERELEMANQILCLIAQRMIVDSRVQMRLFKSARGDDAISQVAFPWHIPDGGSECICYPVRFGMLHGDVLPEHLLAMLGQILDIRHYDVVVYASYQEIDSTQTIELGFRYCEDALYCRALLHGVLADDRYLEVNFLRYMTMEINAVSYPLEGLTTLHRTPKQRLQSVISICAVPGIPAKLLDDAYTLERQLTTWVQEKGHLTLDAVNDLKKEERMPMYDGEFVWFWLMRTYSKLTLSADGN